MNYTYTTLENIQIQTLHKVFLNAFSDYQINISLSLPELQKMLTRRGYASEISVGAFKEPDNELIGFIFNGFRNWDGKLTVYDTGTGVAPLYRKQGITKSIFNKVMQVLAKKSVDQYLLEVLKNNTKAINLYKKLGFEVTRDFSCFILNKEKYIHEASALAYDVKHVTRIETREWELLKSFWNFNPSWQNSIGSINAVSEEFLYVLVLFDDEIVGYGIADKKTGDVPQIAVHKDFRCKGIAKRIVYDLFISTEANKMSVLNVDDVYEDMKPFLLKMGFEQSVGQHEMVLLLDQE